MSAVPKTLALNVLKRPALHYLVCFISTVPRLRNLKYFSYLYILLVASALVSRSSICAVCINHHEDRAGYSVNLLRSLVYL